MGVSKSSLGSLKASFQSHPGYIGAYFKAAEILNDKIEKAEDDIKKEKYESFGDIELIFPRNYLYGFCVELSLKEIIRGNDFLAKECQHH